MPAIKTIRESEVAGEYQLLFEETAPSQELVSALKTALLSAIDGRAIAGVRIEGVEHEFCTLPGVEEALAEIFLNLKAVNFAGSSAVDEVLLLAAKGPSPVTSGSIADLASADSASTTVVNRSHPICSLEEGASVEMQLLLRQGRSYVTAEEHEAQGLPEGFLAIDSHFSPVRTMDLQGERVGDRHALRICVETTGAIAPREALLLSIASAERELIASAQMLGRSISSRA